jgi:hypothetical protein
VQLADEQMGLHIYLQRKLTIFKKSLLMWVNDPVHILLFSRIPVSMVFLS